MIFMEKFMKNITKMFLFILSFYLVLGSLWIGKDVIIHYQNIDGLPILGYHGVLEDKDKEKYFANYPYCMSLSEFKAQMKYLNQNNYHTLTMDEINDYYQNHTPLPKKSVALTFDDGLLNFKTVVKPILEKYNFKATCFVIGYKTTVKNSQNPYKHQYLRKSDLVNDEYVEYYSHSYNLHHNTKYPNTKLIETLSTQEIINDFKQNENIVSSKYFAFPYGRTCDNANEALIKANVSLAFGYNQNRTMTYHDDKYLLQRYLMFSKMPMFYFKWIVE